MSYILDALKKAERERGISKVPTLETIHATPGKPRGVWWTAAAAVLSLLVIIVGAYTFSGNNSARDVTDASGPAELLTQSPDTAPPASEISESSHQLQEDIERNASTEIPSDADTKLPAVPRTDRLETTASSNGIETEVKQVAPAKPQQQDLDERSGEIVPMDPSPIASSVGTNTSSGISTLQEAIEGMNVSIHLYAEDPSNSMIFIDGRKYVEGDYVNGLYLIEAITPDGAVLTYKGARAPLKASM